MKEGDASSEAFAKQQRFAFAFDLHTLLATPTQPTAQRLQDKKQEELVEVVVVVVLLGLGLS